MPKSWTLSLITASKSESEISYLSRLLAKRYWKKSFFGRPSGSDFGYIIYLSLFIPPCWFYDNFLCKFTNSPSLNGCLNWVQFNSWISKKIVLIRKEKHPRRQRREHAREAKFDFHPYPDRRLFHESGNPPLLSVRWRSFVTSLLHF